MLSETQIRVSQPHVPWTVSICVTFERGLRVWHLDGISMWSGCLVPPCRKRSCTSLGGGGERGVLVKLPALWITTGNWMPFCLGIFSFPRLWQAEHLQHPLMCCFDALRGIPSCYFKCVLWNLTPATECTLFNIGLPPYSNLMLVFSLQQNTLRL